MTATRPQQGMIRTQCDLGRAMLEHVPCDLCGADQPTVLFKQGDIHFGLVEPAFQIVRCTVCDLIYLSPRPIPQTIGQHYPREYYEELGRVPKVKVRSRFGTWVRARKASLRTGVLQEFYGYPLPPRDSLEAETASVALRRVLLFGEHLRLRLRGKVGTIIPFVGGGRLLDVGCGGGEFLQHCVALGWEGWGVEINPEAARNARERRGLQVLQGDLFDAAFPAAMFDAVVFSHSLEHMFSPTATLREANRILRPSGRLFLAIPNAASAEARLFGRWWFGWEIPRHLYHFTPRTMDRCLQQAGFRRIDRWWDPGTMSFLESLKYYCNYTRGKAPPQGKTIFWIVKLLTSCFRHLRLGPVMFVHAAKVGESPDAR